MKYTNMNNPSGVRGMTTREEDGQPSGYKSLREKSPSRKSPTRDPAEEGGATKFATVSLWYSINLISWFRVWSARAY